MKAPTESERVKEPDRRITVGWFCSGQSA